MRRLVIGLLLVVLVAPVSAQAPAQPPTLQKALQEAQVLLAARAAELQASEVLKNYNAAKAHVETLTALVRAEAAKAQETGSK